MEERRQAERQRQAAAEAKRRAEEQRLAEEQRQAELRRLEEERRQVAAERIAEERRQAAELAAQQAEERDLAAALAAEEAAQAEPVASDIQFYAAAIDSRIRETWLRPLGSRRDQSCTVEIQLQSSGEVVADSVRVIRSSGDPAYDRSVVAAIYQASPLPVPAGRLFERFRKLRLEFKPGSG